MFYGIQQSQLSRRYLALVDFDEGIGRRERIQLLLDAADVRDSCVKYGLAADALCAVSISRITCVGVEERCLGRTFS